MADLSPELTARIQSLEVSYADNPKRYFVALAGAWREAGEVGRAEEILRENLKRFPGLSAHVLLGRCLADRGAFQEAANEFHYVLSMDAQNLIALRTLAEMAAAGGRRAEAERWYNELLSVDPTNAEARAALQGLARGGADAAVADQPAQVGTGWGGAAEPLDVAGGADAEGADEFGMIDLSAPAASAADASGVAADEDAGWGDLPLDLPSTAQGAPAAASAPAGDFDAFGFGSVDLDAEPGTGAETDETGAVGEWLDADARQDLGESAAGDRGALAPPEDGTAFDPALAAAELPFVDADHTRPADLPLPAPQPGAAPEFPRFDADEADHADAPVDAEVVTETMAELYAAQGLLQQAADTYRELIRQRGDEPGLVRRLAEIEDRLRAAADPGTAASAQEEAPDWLASVDAFAMGGAAAGLAAAHMTADVPAEPADGGPDLAATDSAGPAGPAEAARADDFAPAWVEATAPQPDFAPPAEAAPAGADGYTDAFADSFAGGFDGADAGTAEPALATAPAEAGDAEREPWQAPSVRETEPVGFDLIVVEEDGDVLAAPPEVVADVSADWAIAAAPLRDDEEAAEEERAAAGCASSMRDYFASLLTWQPGQPAARPAAGTDTGTETEPGAAPPAEAASAAEEPWAEAPAPPAAGAPRDEAASGAVPDDEPWAAPAPESAAGAGEPDIPLFDLDAEPWAQPPAAQPPSIDAFELSDEIATPAAADSGEALPWELPAQPAAAAPEADADGGFSFEDFFSGGGAPAPAETPAAAPEPEPEPEPELPPAFVPSLAFEPEAPPAAAAPPPPPAPAAPAAGAPAGGQDEEDEDLESFQAWLQSLKR